MLVVLPHWQSESNWQQVSPNSGTFIRLKFSRFTAPFSIFFWIPQIARKMRQRQSIIDNSFATVIANFLTKQKNNRLMHANVQKYPFLVAIFICLLLSLTLNISVIPTFAKNLITLYLFIFRTFFKTCKMVNHSWKIEMEKLWYFVCFGTSGCLCNLVLCLWLKNVA